MIPGVVNLATIHLGVAADALGQLEMKFCGEVVGSVASVESLFSPLSIHSRQGDRF